MKRVFLAAVLIAVAACSGGGQPAPAGGSSLTIAMIPKGTTHNFWQSIHAGANRAGKELGVEVIWRGPLREDDRDSQVSELEGFISRGVSGIAIAPLDEAALVGPVNDAMAKKIPVVIFDSGLKGDNYVSFVATDNVKGGQLGGERLIQAMGGKGKVVLLRYAEGHDSTSKREEGFLAAMKANPAVEVVSSNQYVGTDVEEAYKRTESILSTYKKPDGSLSIDGIFCANESSSFAAMRVLKDNGWAGKLHFVGFDASDNLLKGLQDGTLDGLVLQDPVKMGYLAIKTLVAHIKGQPVERRIDTGVQVATRENMDQPGMKELVHPDLSK
jgi:ribose transport system substrate-binding protein